MPLTLVERGDLVGKPAAVQLPERDRRLERRQHLADLVEVEMAAGLERESGPLDGNKCAAAEVGIEIASALEHGQDRPDHTRRLGGALPRHARDKLAAVEHAEPLDRAELGSALDESGDLRVVGPVGRRGPGHRSRDRAASRRPGDRLDRAAHGGPDARGGRQLHDLGQRGQRDHRFDRRPQLGDFLFRQVGKGSEDATGVHGRAHSRPPLISRELVRDQGERGDRHRLLTLDVPVLGDGLEQGARGGRLDAPAPSEDLQLLPGQVFEAGHEAPRLRVEHVGAGERDQGGERRVVDRKLQRGQL